jgi:hypothetical protein
MASRQSESANRTVVYSIMCMHIQCCISVSVTFYAIHTYTYIIRKYWTIGIIGPPTPPISPFIRGSTVFPINIMEFLLL